jgi:type II secretory pathway pseudopilin PulG
MLLTRSPLFCSFLSLLMVLAPAAAMAQELGGLDQSLLTEDTFFVGVAYPHRAVHAPGMEMIPREIISAEALEAAGVDPLMIERLLLAVDKLTPGAAPNFGAKIEFLEAFDLDAILEKVPVGTETAEHGGKQYLRVVGLPMPLALYVPEPKTLVIGTEPIVQRAIEAAAGPAKHPLRTVLQSQGDKNDLMVAVALDPVRDLVNMGLQQLPPLPPEFERFKQAPDLISMAMVRLNGSQPQPTGLVLAADDAARAEELEKLANQGLDMARTRILDELRNEMDRAPKGAIGKARREYVERVSTMLVEQVRPLRKGRLLTLESESSANTQLNVATIGILVALLLPAVQAARAAARRASSMNNMKMIGLAMHNYHDVKGHFPAPAIIDSEGKPLLSWRVAILPMIEEQALFDQFHLDEPWDSAHNIKLLQRMPQVYRSPNSTAGTTMSNYLLPVSKETMFAETEGPRMADIRDGTSNTILALEADAARAVEWTRPADLAYDSKQPVNGLGGMRPGGFLTLFCDGSVRIISGDVDEGTLRALFTSDGGERIARDALD